MSYIIMTPDIEKKYKATLKYRARTTEEDAGNGYVKDTPEWVLEYDREIDDYYRSAMYDSQGRAIM